MNTTTSPRGILRPLATLVLLLAASMFAHAQVSIDAVYFAQTHVMKSTDSYFGLVSNKDALIKAHIVDPGASPAPTVTATLDLDGSMLVLPMTGPGTLPISIPDGPGVVDHAASASDSFIVNIPAAWVQPGLEVTITAGAASEAITSITIGARTKVIMRMFDIGYFGPPSGDYPAGTFEELEAKWPVRELEVRRLPGVSFPELVIPPRGGNPAIRCTSPSDYFVQTGTGFDGEQAAALAWNGALKRAGGRSGRVYLSYINIYNVNAGGQAGGFSGVGNGTSAGILHHELGHALSLPHWGGSGAYPYKGSMFGIDPRPTNDTHAGPTWAYDPGTATFLPPTRNLEISPGVFDDVYKVDPMQGGGTGDQEAPFILNHFSDYSVNQARNYLEGHVLIWNDTAGQYGSWNQASADYSNYVTTNGINFPSIHDAEVITVMASISGASQDVNMVYPPIGPYTGGFIKLFDPESASDRAQAISTGFVPGNGCDLCLRITQGGVESTYMLAAPWETGLDPLSGGSLKTEGVNLLASNGTVTRAELLLTPDAQVNGLPVDPQVLYTWSPVTPDPASFEVVPTAGGSTAITMRATEGISLGDPVEYLFTEITGNPGGTSSGWQSSTTYTDTGLQASTQYAYTVTMRAGAFLGQPSVAFYETTNPTGVAGTITVDSTQQFNLVDSGNLQPVIGLGAFDAAGADKLVVVISTEHGFNNGTGYVNEVRYNGTIMTEVIQEDAGIDRGTAAMFYLDNPGPIGAGTIEVNAAGPNGGLGAAYALSGTAAGYGAAASTTGDTVTSVSLTTSGDNALVIACLENSGNSNSAGTPTTIDPPLTQVSSGGWGSQWGGHASGYQTVATPSTVTPAFSTNTGSGYSINIIAAEFLAEPVSGDTTPPTLAAADIVDDKSGGTVFVGEQVTYTVTFSEAIAASSITTSDFENGASAAITVQNVNPTGNAAVYEVVVNPDGAGTKQLQVKSGTNIEDLSGNALDTASAIADDTTLTVINDSTPPTLVSITDNVGGGPITTAQTVTYTVTFSEAMDPLTITTGDFNNGASPAALINSVTATGNPAVFEVSVTPGGVGSLLLQIRAGVSLTDLAGNALDTTTDLPDDTTITVNVPSPNTATLGVGFQATIASEQHPTYAGEARYYHVSTNPANPGTGIFAATIPGSNTPGPVSVRNYDGPVQAYKFAGGTNNDINAVAQQGGPLGGGIITFATSDTSFDGFGQQQAKIWTSDPGSDIEVAGSDPYNASDDVGSTGGWRSLGGAVGTIAVTAIPGGTGSIHIYYGAFSSTPTLSVVMRDTDGPEPDLTIADAHLNGDAANRTEYYLAEIDFDTDGIYDEIEFTWDSDGDGNTATGNGRGLAVVVTSSVADTSAPTLATSDIVDDQGGGPFTSTGDSITYTVTYSEFMDPATIDASDFGVTGTASATIDSVVHFGGVTTVVVTPTPATSGTLQLQVNAGAVLTDLAGNALDTTSAIADAPAVTIVSDVTPPTLVSITDSVSGADILEGQTVVYTVTFDEPMKASTIGTTDFENGGSPAAVIGAVNATANPAVFEVVASAAYPGGVGTLILQIKAGANLEDLSSNSLNTGAALPDDTTITVNAQETRLIPTIDLPFATGDVNSNDPLNLTYDASGSDKLVIIATKEGNSNPFTTLTYEGQPLTLAVGTGSSANNQHWNGIYYLDDPGSYHTTGSTGAIVAASGSNRNIITAVGLSNTAPGAGGVAAPPAPDDSKTVDLPVNFVDSMVIASHGMGQNGNTANVTSVNTVSPLVEMSAIERGNNWVGHVTGYASAQGPGLLTYEYAGGSTTGVNTIAVEFPGALSATSTPYSEWAASNGLTEGVNDAQTDDADSGGQNNFYEFAFGGNPLNRNDDGALMHAFTADGDGDSDVDAVLTVLVRAGATWTYSGPAATATVDGVNYSIAGSATLPVSGAVNVLEGTTVITTGLPAAPFGYEYKSFILEGSVSEGLGEGYFQATVTAAP